MPGTHLDREKFIQILNGRKMQEVLQAKGDEAIAIAHSIYEGRSKHDDRHIPEYRDSFFVRHGHTVTPKGDVVPKIDFGNRSGRWWWVEFGAHAGGKTPVLHYRVLGLTLDAMASR